MVLLISWCNKVLIKYGYTDFISSFIDTPVPSILVTPNATFVASKLCFSGPFSLLNLTI